MPEIIDNRTTRLRGSCAGTSASTRDEGFRSKMLTSSGVKPIVITRNCREVPRDLTKYTAGPLGARMIPPGTLI